MCTTTRAASKAMPFILVCLPTMSEMMQELKFPTTIPVHFVGTRGSDKMASDLEEQKQGCVIEFLPAERTAAPFHH